MTPTRRPSGKSEWNEPSAVVLTVGVLTIFRFWAASNTGLAPDEAYYWLWSQTPDFGYADHPPMIAWWIWLSTRILGSNELGVRALTVLSVLVTTIAVYGTGAQLWDRLIGLRAAMWFNAMILIGVGAIFSTPDAPSTIFWALTVWVLSMILRTQRSWLWIVVGGFAGLGCIAKYTNLFLGLGIVAWLMIDRASRHWLRSPWLWAGGVVACLVFLPVFIWNSEHDWISFAQQFGRMRVHGVTLRYIPELFVVQFGLLNPLIAYFAALGICMALRNSNDYRSNPSMFLAAIAAPLVVYMVVHAFHDRVQANWLAPIYPQAAILAAAAVSRSPIGVPTNRSIVAVVVPFGCALSVVALLYLSRPFELVLPFASPANRLQGWQDLAMALDEFRRRSGATWIATANYDVNAELAFYIPGRVPVRQITERQRYSSTPIDSNLTSQTALLVFPERESEAARLKGCFKSVQPLSVVSRPEAGGSLDQYAIENAVVAQPDILTAGCHFHRHKAKALTDVSSSLSSRRGVRRPPQ
jgi:4-amino-4-deoxy-L-arabinose transferase-like glycosyltransferase